jgi:hypothetical protein
VRGYGLSIGSNPLVSLRIAGGVILRMADVGGRPIPLWS